MSPEIVQYTICKQHKKIYWDSKRLHSEDKDKPEMNKPIVNSGYYRYSCYDAEQSKWKKGSGYFPLSYASFGLSVINIEVGLALVVLVMTARDPSAIAIRKP